MHDYLRNGRLLTLMLGHLTVDSYGGVLPVLYPLLIQEFRLNLAAVGLLGLAYGGTAAASQPMFGAIADRFGTRLTGLALVWTAVSFALVGFIGRFPLLLLVACAAGLGSGAFHPFGALNVRALLSERRHSTGMSIYVTSGTVGSALGPLIGVAAFGLLGTHGTALLVTFGLASGSYLLWRMGHAAPVGQSMGRRTGRNGQLPIVALVVVVGVMMSRTWTMFVFQAFIPTWYKQLGYGAPFYGALATTLVLSSAIGMIGCGTLADRFGRRFVILITLALSMPAIVLFTAFPGPPAFGSAILIGFLAASTAPILIVMAQQLMANRAGLASGLVMGLGFVTGSIGIPVSGALADAIGIRYTLMANVLLVAVTILLAWFLPSERQMEYYSAPVAAKPATPRVSAEMSPLQ